MGINSKSRWTLIKEKDTGRQKNWYRCDCGTERVVNSSLVKSGRSKSCGCLNREISYAKSDVNGRCKDYTYKSYSHMKYRCLNKNSTSWDRYGGRGIRVCDRWVKSYQHFLDDMGERPEGTTIERVNVNGNYEPSNCRWATVVEQNKNKRNTISLSFYEVEMCAVDWEKIMEVPRGRITGRLLKGWDKYDAVFTPSKNALRGNGRAKLSSDKVRKIKELLQKGETDTTIGNMYNVHRRTISDIRNNKTWKNV